MNHVFYTHKTPDTFEEHLDFNYEIPYTVRVKKFLVDDIVPMHYGETIEVLICDNLLGDLIIEGQKFILEGQQLFVIPPNIVHSTTTKKCQGTMYVIKFSLEAMANFINIPAILGYHNKQVAQFLYTPPEYMSVYQIVKALIDDDENLILCLSHIIRMINILQKHTTDYAINKVNIFAFKHSSLRELITWTQNNFHKSISIEEVANRVGYSKCYFCSKFKSITGITYLEYLNSVKISHACSLLKQNKTVETISYECGFENVSYFIQLFKKTLGITPKAYAKKQQQFYYSHNLV